MGVEENKVSYSFNKKQAAFQKQIGIISRFLKAVGISGVIFCSVTIYLGVLMKEPTPLEVLAPLFPFVMLLISALGLKEMKSWGFYSFLLSSGFVISVASFLFIYVVRAVVETRIITGSSIFILLVISLFTWRYKGYFKDRINSYLSIFCFIVGVIIAVYCLLALGLLS